MKDSCMDRYSFPRGWGKTADETRWIEFYRFYILIKYNNIFITSWSCPLNLITIRFSGLTSFFQAWLFFLLWSTCHLLGLTVSCLTDFYTCMQCFALIWFILIVLMCVFNCSIDKHFCSLMGISNSFIAL